MRIDREYLQYTLATLALQAVRLGAPAMLWQRALHCGLDPSSSGEAGAPERLACALATALADLLAYRGDDELAAAALRIVFDPRLAAWHDALAADASRPPRVAAAASIIAWHCAFCAGSSPGVRASPPSFFRRPLSRSYIAKPRLSLNPAAPLPRRRLRGRTGPCTYARLPWLAL